MSVLPRIITLKTEAVEQLYQWIDQEIRSLPKRDDGKFDQYAEGLVDNDIDALRHSFVSGVYVLEFSEQTSDILGRLQEFQNFDSGPNVVGAENMDLWNNAIGRKAAKKVKTWRDLYDLLIQLMNRGDLILDPSDKRKYQGPKSIRRIPKSFVIKVRESRTGANIEFYDFRQKIMMSKEEFIKFIREGKYPGYAVRKHQSGEFPYSTRDKFSFNNLG